MIKFLDLAAQYRMLKSEIDPAVASVIEAGSFVGGESVENFERAFGSYQSVSHCVGVGNGTDALEIALEALQLPPGSEVIVPANSFIATSEAVTRAGHRVVFADVEPDSHTLSVDDVARRIGPSTAAVIAVHLYGHPCDMPRLTRLASSKGVKVIEDCAQAHGAEISNRRVGSIGNVGAFSFYPGKNLGAYGDGGAITTNDAALARRCRMVANHGRIEKYNHEFEGRNSRLDALQAAVLLVKLRHLDDWIAARNEQAEEYERQLSGLAGVELLKCRPDVRHSRHLFVIRCDKRDALSSYLAAKGIQTGVHYPIALPKLAAYRYLNQAAENLFANCQDVRLLSLPIGEHLALPDIRLVATHVRQFFAS
jgi:dTDP-4-amino-4,6-dideoxygalactose transaminase